MPQSRVQFDLVRLHPVLSDRLLAALRTLMLNGGWERYWQEREVLPLLAS